MLSSSMTLGPGNFCFATGMQLLAWPSFTTLLTVSKEWALITEAGNSALMSWVFHRLAGNMLVRLHTRSYYIFSLYQLAQKCIASHVSKKW